MRLPEAPACYSPHAQDRWSASERASQQLGCQGWKTIRLHQQQEGKRCPGGMKWWSLAPEAEPEALKPHRERSKETADLASRAVCPLDTGVGEPWQTEPEGVSECSGCWPCPLRLPSPDRDTAALRPPPPCFPWLCPQPTCARQQGEQQDESRKHQDGSAPVRSTWAFSSAPCELRL